MRKKIIEKLHEQGFHESIIDGIVDGIFFGLETDLRYAEADRSLRLEQVLNAIQETLNEN